MQVCKLYLVKLCPHELFTNTKSDLGHCDKVHDEALKQEYVFFNFTFISISIQNFVLFLGELDTKRVTEGELMAMSRNLWGIWARFSLTWIASKFFLFLFLSSFLIQTPCTSRIRNARERLSKTNMSKEPVSCSLIFQFGDVFFD